MREICRRVETGVMRREGNKEKGWVVTMIIHRACYTDSSGEEVSPIREQRDDASVGERQNEWMAGVGRLTNGEQQQRHENKR